MKRKNIERCRTLRKKMTDAERKLWSILRNRQLDGIKFRRQFSIDRYILDFYCPEYKLGIEADGGHHYGEKGRDRDERRTRELKKLGIEIIRFSDYEILTNIEGVCEVIKSAIERKNKESPSPQILSPEGRGKMGFSHLSNFSCSSRSSRLSRSSGQTTVEALFMFLVLIIYMFIFIQITLIGIGYIQVNHAAFAAARAFMVGASAEKDENEDEAEDRARGEVEKVAEQVLLGTISAFGYHSDEPYPDIPIGGKERVEVKWFDEPESDAKLGTIKFQIIYRMPAFIPGIIGKNYIELKNYKNIARVVGYGKNVWTGDNSPED